MARKSSADTPVMRHYLELKQQYPDGLLFYRMGDFFELFFDDAVKAARLLEVTLTSRDRNADDPVPMAGVPHHAVNIYIRKALDQGCKVVLCDQVEDPKLARGLVKRAVTRVITPGVVLESDQLDASRNNYLLTVAGSEGALGLAALDLSTFELRTAEVPGPEALADEISRLGPAEVVFEPTLEPVLSPLRATLPALLQPAAPGLFAGPDEDLALVCERSESDLPSLGLGDLPLALRASAAALRYAVATQPGIEVRGCRLCVYRPGEHLQLDEATLANLEVFETLMERRRRGSLLSVLDRTCTPMGSRLLRQELGLPLREVAAIRRRLDAVELLSGEASLRRGLQEHLGRVFDLERLTSRVVLKAATPRELGRLGLSLLELPELSKRLFQAIDDNLARELPALLAPPEDLLPDLAGAILGTLVDEPPPTAREGGIIRPGVNAELDRLVGLSDGGKENILRIETEERKRCGISSLKVKFTNAFGYFIEIPRAKADRIPADYQRKQTLVGAERFITPELSRLEAEVLGAEERRVTLEQELFEALRDRVSAEAPRLRTAARWVAWLDVLCGLSEVAHRQGYTRPEVDSGRVIRIEEGRHPVVEQFLPAGQFVPNDLQLDPDEARMVVLTGPNMAGKSTVMRQVALITLMAQMGSFVPARRAQIGLVDRIFTRVGASDNLARGESTFMVEMRETATILRHATSSSLVVMDEIGRGTATYDGISIAWAVAEFLHDRVSAKCLFATHYHELCALSEVKPFVRNVTIAVQEWKGGVVFLRQLVPGGSSRSYGIEVARLAGLHPWVVKRARRVLAALEGGEPLEGLPVRGGPGQGSKAQLSLFDRLPKAPPVPVLTEEEQEALFRLRALDVDHMTPMQALTTLADLCQTLKGRPESQ